MLIGEVVGRLWASRQAEGLGGRRLLLVRPLTGKTDDNHPVFGPGLVVAVDGLGAGTGERVLVAHGSRVRDLTVGASVADKDIVVGIVDDFHVTDPGAAPREVRHAVRHAARRAGTGKGRA